MLSARRRVRAWWVVLPAVILVLAASCAHVNTDLTKLPAVELGEPSFYPTLEAYAGAPIVGGNGVEILLNGEQIFPAVLEAIRGAQRTITYAQYFFEEGPVARDIAEALAERCRAGVGVNVLLDGFGSLNMPRPRTSTRCGTPAATSCAFRPLVPVRLPRATTTATTAASSSSTAASASRAGRASAASGWATGGPRTTGATPTSGSRGPAVE